MFPMSQEPMGPPQAQMGQPMGGMGQMPAGQPPMGGPPNALMALSMSQDSGLGMPMGDLGLYLADPQQSPIVQAMLAFNETMLPAFAAAQPTPQAPNSLMGMQ